MITWPLTAESQLHEQSLHIALKSYPDETSFVLIEADANSTPESLINNDNIIKN